MSKVAVILFNLGGPDRPESVKPFLHNLFSDPAILRVPGPVRRFLAWRISSKRAPIAQEVYHKLGGGSPLLSNTHAQAEALTDALTARLPGDEVRVFICMRYWHPMSSGTVQAVKEYGPEEIVLLPLYPQYSTTTSASSLQDWRGRAAEAGLSVPSRAVCCYPTEPGFITAIVHRLKDKLAEARHSAPSAPLRILFSAHGLPQKIIDKGDPYQWQVEQTAAAVLAQLAEEGEDALDSQVCYQSRVGPLKWIGPSTEDEIARAGRDKAAVVLVPIAFVSEHSETLVELDMEYRELAEKEGVPAYLRVETVGTDPAFIGGLADLVMGLRSGGKDMDSARGGRHCPMHWLGCPMG